MFDPAEKVRRREAKSQFGAAELRRFQLLDALSAGGSAAAKVLVWDITDAKYETSTETITVYSVNQAAGPSGSQGVCRFAPDRRDSGGGVWEVVEAMGGTPTVKRVRFMLPSALNGQASVANCPIIQDWYGNAGATQITAWNEDGWVSDAGSEGLADWNPAEAKWVIILLPCATGTS